MTNKHEEHECEECGKRLPTSFELLLHATKHHSKKCRVCDKEIETSVNLSSHVAIEHNEEHETLNMLLHSTPKIDMESKNSKFVFNESTLNEFL